MKPKRYQKEQILYIPDVKHVMVGRFVWPIACDTGRVLRNSRQKAKKKSLWQPNDKIILWTQRHAEIHSSLTNVFLAVCTKFVKASYFLWEVGDQLPLHRPPNTSSQIFTYIFVVAHVVLALYFLNRGLLMTSMLVILLSSRRDKIPPLCHSRNVLCQIFGHIFVVGLAKFWLLY